MPFHFVCDIWRRNSLDAIFRACLICTEYKLTIQSHFVSYLQLCNQKHNHSILAKVTPSLQQIARGDFCHGHFEKIRGRVDEVSALAVWYTLSVRYLTYLLDSPFSVFCRDSKVWPPYQSCALFFIQKTTTKAQRVSRYKRTLWIFIMFIH